MYELEYVRKRKRRIRAAIIGGVSTIVVSSLCIIAFLGRFVGTFTVSLEANDVNISLSEKESGSRSSFLRVNSLKPFQEYTYSRFDSKYGDDLIDSEETSYTLGANYSVSANNTIVSYKFFKYTFYVINTGSVEIMYDFTLNILDNVKSADGRSLLDTLRVTIYENGVKSVYGKRDSVPHGDDNDDYRPPISANEGEAEFTGYVDATFTSSDTVTSFKGKDLSINEAKRYTIVTWLEGFRSDPDKGAPIGATIKLGVEINAYEI
jgi:hypothetical protein